MQALGSGIARFLLRLWRIIRWPLAIIAAIYVLLVIYYLFELPKESKATVAAIQAQKLTMKDVDGSNLPPVPDAKLVDATVEGVDANKNGIRDDVELAIFKKYPNNMKLRAAALQYAMKEQWFLSPMIRDKATWKAAAEQETRAVLCVKDVLGPGPLTFENYVEGLIFNTDPRRSQRDRAYTYTTSSGTAAGPHCDVELK